MCLGVTSIALAMVMAGTGDLMSLRLLRELRWRVDEGITFGAILEFLKLQLKFIFDFFAH